MDEQSTKPIEITVPSFFLFAIGFMVVTGAGLLLMFDIVCRERGWS